MQCGQSSYLCCWNRNMTCKSRSFRNYLFTWFLVHNSSSTPTMANQKEDVAQTVQGDKDTNKNKMAYTQLIRYIAPLLSNSLIYPQSLFYTVISPWRSEMQNGLKFSSIPCLWIKKWIRKFSNVQWLSITMWSLFISVQRNGNGYEWASNLSMTTCNCACRPSKPLKITSDPSIVLK